MLAIPVKASLSELTLRPDWPRGRLVPNMGARGGSVRLSWIPPTIISARSRYCTAEYFEPCFWLSSLFHSFTRVSLSSLGLSFCFLVLQCEISSSAASTSDGAS